MYEKRKAFSLAEMMVVMLVVSILIAASMPIISKHIIRNNNSNPTTPSTQSVGDVLYLYGWTNDAYGGYGYTNSGIAIVPGGGYYKQLTPTVAFNLYPPECPPDWSSAGVGVQRYISYEQGSLVRTCYHPTKTCSVLYLYGNDNYGQPGVGDGGPEVTCPNYLQKELSFAFVDNICETLNNAANTHYAYLPYYPKQCPIGWADAGVGIDKMNFNSATLIRPCYKCD